MEHCVNGLLLKRCNEHWLKTTPGELQGGCFQNKKKKKKKCQCSWETENISGLKECRYFCCKVVQGSLASPSDICSSLSCANANSSSQKRWNIPLCSQTHLSSGLLCSCQQLGHLGFITELLPPASHFCCWQLCSESCWACLRWLSTSPSLPADLMGNPVS